MLFRKFISFMIVWIGLFMTFPSLANVPTTLKPIVILSAMKSEYMAVQKLLTDPQQVYVNGIFVTEAQYAGKPILLVPTGIGEVNAASVTAAVIQTFHPRTILFSGIAGETNPDFPIGGIVVGQSLYAMEHQDITTPSSDDINMQTNKINPISLPGDPSLLQLAQAIQRAHSFQEKIIFGRIATTDIFPPSLDEIQRAIDNHCDAMEMEGFAVSAVGAIYHIGVLVIRGISDTRPKGTNSLPPIDPHNKLLAENNAAAFTMALVARLPA